MFKLLEQYFTYKCDKTSWDDLKRYDFKRFFLKINSGNEIDCIYKDNDSDILIIFSHGNASNISGLNYIYDFYNKLNVNYIAYDYPGYGRSTGNPSEKLLYESLEAVLSYCTNKLKINESQIILHGMSLGGAVTIEIAGSNTPKGVIIESAFTSTHEMSKFMFPKLKLHRFVKNKFININKIDKIRSPLLLIHGTEDETVPFYMGEELFKKAVEPKSFYRMEGVGHSDQIELGGKPYFELIRSFVNNS